MKPRVVCVLSMAMYVAMIFLVLPGVETRLKGQFYPVMIAPDLVPELHLLELTDEGLLVGAAVTLASLDARLQQLTASLPHHKTQVFQAMLEMLRWFAGPQIRNVSVSNAPNRTRFA